MNDSDVSLKSSRLSLTNRKGQTSRVIIPEKIDDRPTQQSQRMQQADMLHSKPFAVTIEDY